MAFKTVQSLDADVTVALGKKDKKTGKPYPKQAEGYYLGSRTVDSKKGESKLHFLQTAKGNLGVWGTTDLNRKLAQVIAGTMIRITSTGTKPTPNGDMYTYNVEQDSEQTIEVNVDSGAAAYSDEDENDSSDAGYSDDDSEEDSYAAAAEVESAAARSARVQELLKSAGAKAKSK